MSVTVFGHSFPLRYLVIAALVSVAALSTTWVTDVAADDTDASGATYTAISPCRLIDTRPGSHNVGGRTAPLGPGDTISLTPTFRPDGCPAFDVPVDPVALALNVTALNATRPSFLTFWAEGPRPLASSLNPVPGQPPTPNAVTVVLAADGSFNVYNAFGSVDVIIDIVGFYDAVLVEDLLDRVGTLEQENAAQQATIDDLHRTQPFAGMHEEHDDEVVAVGDTTQRNLILVDVPAPGTLTITSRMTVASDGAAELHCVHRGRLLTPANIEFAAPRTVWSSSSDGQRTTTSDAFVFPVPEVGTVAMETRCANQASSDQSVTIERSSLVVEYASGTSTVRPQDV